MAVHDVAPELAEATISDLSVVDISMSRGREFIKEHHYTGGCAVASMIWGVEYAETLVGAIAFHTPISENLRKSIFEADSPKPCDCSHIDGDHYYRQHLTELHRLVTLDDCPKNTESWFISKALSRLKEYKPKYWAVVSFADSTEDHTGTIYQASNALYYGMTAESTFYRDQEGTLRPPRNGGENISVAEARKRGWEVEERGQKHRYLFLIGDSEMSKQELREKLTVELDSYPSV